MDRRIAVVTPAFRAEAFIAEAARSVLAQTFDDWELWLISDDGTDYEAVLGAAGLVDRRFRFLSTGTVGAGASRARNLALDDHPIVASALDVMDDAYRRLRLVGAGPDHVLAPGRYKFTNLSMDSMIVWDRRRCDARYDLELTNMTDLELLMQLWSRAETTYQLGTPAHDYVKVSSSMSNGEGVTERMIRSKRTLLDRLERGHYRFAAPGTTEGLAAFLTLSLGAEAAFPEALAARPGLLFEDHLEPMLRRHEAGELD